MDNGSLKKKLTQACAYIERSETLPSLTAVAKHIGLSPAYFQKIFSQSLGISPRNYADAVRFRRLKKKLREGQSVSAALYDTGFGGSSRLYEFTNRYLGMTPAIYRKRGFGITIYYTITDSPMGFLLLAATSKGICSVRLDDKKNKLLEEFKKEFSKAELKENSAPLKKWIQALVDYLAGNKPWPVLPYDVRATAFQRRVWEWLRTIPSGTTYNYSEAAKAIGRPSAVRAVARACAANPVALVIPCHRILPKAGGAGGYRWKPERKEKLLKLEQLKRK